MNKRLQRLRPPLVAVGPLIFLMVVCAMSSAHAAPADGCLAGPEARALAVVRYGQYGSDFTALLMALDGDVGVAVDGGFDLAGPLRMDILPGVQMNVGTPYRVYRQALPAVLMGFAQPSVLDGVQEVTIAFLPESEAIEIVKFVIERNGREIKPRKGSISDSVKVGKRRSLVGTLMFDCSVFSPGATVKATATLKDGTKLTHTFTEAQLQSLK
jgi:hypothetical protein